MKKGKDTLVSGMPTKAPKPSRKDQAKARKIVKELNLPSQSRVEAATSLSGSFEPAQAASGST